MKSLLIRPYAKYIANQVKKDRKNALSDQSDIFKELINKGKATLFGKNYGFADIHSQETFANRVPVQDYEGMRNYFDKMVSGEPDVFWPGKPKYYAKTSGTTSGIKYIPLTKESIPNHIGTARSALMTYAAHAQNTSIFEGKMMFLSGSPILSYTEGIATGRLSGIVNHELPGWIKGNQLPTFETNCIRDWETKLERVVNETKGKDLRLISGIPPWVQMYFERLLKATGRSAVKDVFPNLQVFMYGGVNYEPYRTSIENLIGESIDSVELYPASEGFLAFQDTLENQGLLLNTNSGIYFEFVPLEEIHKDSPIRLGLEDVELQKDYVLILSNNAGLWAYNLGDTIRFVHLNPYRIVVSGRVKHFISAFGEHVIGKEVEQAMLETCAKYEASVREFTVAPQVNPVDDVRPYHEWFVEFEKEPLQLEQFALELDENLRSQNAYYDDLIAGKILRTLMLRSLPQNTFRNYMKAQGKLGGQNKVPRLSNDRALADRLNY